MKTNPIPTRYDEPEAELIEKIHTATGMPKAEIIRLGHSLGLDYGLTTSCYDPGPAGRPCGDCDSCRLRAAGFAAAGLIDPRVVGWGSPRAGSG